MCNFYSLKGDTVAKIYPFVGILIRLIVWDREDYFPVVLKESVFVTYR